MHLLASRSHNNSDGDILMKLFSNLSLTIKKCDGDGCKKVFLPAIQKPALEKDGKIYCQICAVKVIDAERLAQLKEQYENDKAKKKKKLFDIGEMDFRTPRVASGVSGKLIRGSGYGHSGFSGYKGPSAEPNMANVNSEDITRLSELLQELVKQKPGKIIKKRRNVNG